MSHVAHESALSCMWMSRGINLNDVCHTHKWTMYVTHINEVYIYIYIYVFPQGAVVVFERCMSHTYVKDNNVCHTQSWHLNDVCHTHKWGTSHIWMSHSTHIGESCHTCVWGMWHIWVTAHIEMSLVTRIIVQCHKYG